VNTSSVDRSDRSIRIEDNENSIIDAIAMGHAWKGPTVAFSFTAQDIDNNGIADFDEGDWREFYTGILGNVTDLTGTDFWEQEADVGTIQFQLTPGGGGASGVPGPGAAPSSGTKIGIGGGVEDASYYIGRDINHTHTWFHETGHALGLAHPHDYKYDDGIDVGIGKGNSSVLKPGDHYLNSKLWCE